jgi:hypothetical protein
MALSRATYCTREDILSVLSVLATPRMNPKIDGAIEAATVNIESRLNRTFHPFLATKIFPWPDISSSAWSYRLWLDGNDLLSVTSLVSGPTVFDPVLDIFLEPARYGPPYTRLEINLGRSAAFSIAVTNQRAITITGEWGYGNQTQSVGTLNGAITNGATTLILSSGALTGVGDLLTIGTERILVTGRSAVTSGQTLQTPMTASSANTSCAVTTGSAFAEGEVITLDTEQLLITAVTGNTLTVERAVNSTVLATHTGSTIYSSRQFTVVRAQNGTTAASHADVSPVARAVVPAPIRALAIAETLVDIQKADSGYARVSGSGDNDRPLGAVAGLNDLRSQVEAGFQRKGRMRVV